MNIPKDRIKSLEDLSFLKEISEDYQIIGLGEATHGNKEFHEIRAEFSKYLIQNCGYTNVIMEFPFSKSETVNEYILKGKGNLDGIMNNLGYWTCATEEVKDFIIWLREFNKNSQQKTSIFGNDVDIDDKIRFKPGRFRDKKMADKTLSLTKNKTSILWAHNHHVSKFDGGDFASMGHFLSEKVDYYAVATLFYEGSLTAMEYDSDKSQWGDIKSFEMPTAESDSLESDLAKLKEKQFFFDLTKLTKKNKANFKNTKIRFLGAGFDPKEKSSMFQSMDFTKMFDGLIFVRKVSPSILIRN